MILKLASEHKASATTGTTPAKAALPDQGETPEVGALPVSEHKASATTETTPAKAAQTHDVGALSVMFGSPSFNFPYALRSSSRFSRVSIDTVPNEAASLNMVQSTCDPVNYMFVWYTTVSGFESKSHSDLFTPQVGHINFSPFYSNPDRLLKMDPNDHLGVVTIVTSDDILATSNDQVSSNVAIK